MSEADWQRLQKVFTLHEATRGDYLVKVGEKKRMLYQLVKGQEARHSFHFIRGVQGYP
jgi:hypothetical protein